jgi:hypothetical protein
MAQKSAMSQSQLTGAISAKDGSRLNLDAMRNTMASLSCGSVKSAANEDENQP